MVVVGHTSLAGSSIIPNLAAASLTRAMVALQVAASGSTKKKSSR